EVRAAYRTLAETQRSYEIQEESARLAERRVESTQLLLELGRARTRDRLEAETARLTARNAVTAALVDHALARLALERDVGTLRVDAQGWWDPTPARSTRQAAQADAGHPPGARSEAAPGADGPRATETTDSGFPAAAPPLRPAASGLAAPPTRTAPAPVVRKRPAIRAAPLPSSASARPSTPTQPTPLKPGVVKPGGVEPGGAAPRPQPNPARGVPKPVLAEPAGGRPAGGLPAAPASRAWPAPSQPAPSQPAPSQPARLQPAPKPHTDPASAGGLPPPAVRPGRSGSVGTR
ncbi:MAG: TolC family protein, partial [Planctomycetota bacterium]|nr:TolC family protein [Planctomycetota bacterium]